MNKYQARKNANTNYRAADLSCNDHCWAWMCYVASVRAHRSANEIAKLLPADMWPSWMK